MIDGFGERLKSERQKFGKGSAEFAELCGVGKNTQTFYEKSDRKPDLSYLAKAHDLGCDIMYIVTGEKGEQQLMVGECKTHQSHETVNVYPYDLNDTQPGEANAQPSLSFKLDWLHERKLEQTSLSVVEAQGDSMEPTITDKDALLVDTRPVNSVTDGIYILKFDNDLIVKRLQKQFDNSIEVISDNPNYKSQNLSGEQVDRLQLVGKVVWIGKDL
jgi:transcriptional regulator with XRE-family HTH domain